MLKIPRTAILASGLALVGALLAVTPAVAAEQVNLPTPVSPNGQHLLDLYNLIMIPALVVFAGVEVGLLVIIVKYRRRRVDEIPRQIHGSAKLEVIWTAIPLVIVLVIAALSGSEIFRDSLARPVGDSRTMEVVVTGSRFAWDYQYSGVTRTDGTTFTTHNVLYVPTHQLVRLRLESHDVIHSWWVPAITGKTDAVPGYDNYTWMNISAPTACPAAGDGGQPLVGTDSSGKPTFNTDCHWHGECAELCGSGHADMQIDVVAIDDWGSWLHGQLTQKP